MTRQRDELSLSFPTDKTLEALEEEFSPGNMPEIRVVKKDGPTEKIYANHMVTGLALRKDDGVRKVTITMKAAEISQSQAAQGNIAELEKKIEEAQAAAEDLKAILSAIEEGIANA